MSAIMLSTGSCRANVHNSGLSKQIGSFCVIKLTMILSAYPTPPVANQAIRSVRGGPHTGQMPLCEAETDLSPFLHGRGSCEEPRHKTSVMPGSAACTKRPAGGLFNISPVIRGQIEARLRHTCRV